MLETELTWEPQLIQGWPEFVTRVEAAGFPDKTEILKFRVNLSTSQRHNIENIWSTIQKSLNLEGIRKARKA